MASFFKVVFWILAIPVGLLLLALIQPSLPPLSGHVAIGLCVFLAFYMLSKNMGKNHDELVKRLDRIEEDIYRSRFE